MWSSQTTPLFEDLSICTSPSLSWTNAPGCYYGQKKETPVLNLSHRYMQFYLMLFLHYANNVKYLLVYIRESGLKEGRRD